MKNSIVTNRNFLSRYTWTQSSAVKISEAVIRCNNFSFAKAMLLNV